jgi:hypothetical protein
MTKEIFYRVALFITTFEQHASKNCLFEDDYDFPINPYMSSEELSQIRKKAMDFYNERLEQVTEGNFHIPFATPSDLEMNENAAYGLTVSIIELYEDGEEDEWFLTGEDEELLKEGKAEEERIISEILITNQ